MCLQIANTFELLIEFNLCYLFSCPLEMCIRKTLFTGFSHEEMLKELLNVWLEFTGLQSTGSCLCTQNANKALSNQRVASERKKLYEFYKKQFLMYNFYLRDF